MAQKRNSWETGYTSILFLERALRQHQRVEDFTRSQDILFEIIRTGDLDPVVAVLVGRYVISLADVIRAKAEFPDMQCIVAQGNWCGYTSEAKEYGHEHGIGVFQVVEFLGSLWSRDYINYQAPLGNAIRYDKSA